MISPLPWSTGTLGRVMTLQRGYDLPGRLRKAGVVPIVSSSGISDFHAESLVLAPGVVTGRYGTIGQTFYLQEDFWPLNTTLFVSNFHGNDPKFCYYILKTIDFASHSGKSGVPGINRNDIHEISLSVPTEISEQRAIAESLGDADALIEGLEALIAKKRDIKLGAMQELLAGDRRLPGFEGLWTYSSLWELSDRQKARFDDGDWIEAEHITDEGVRFIQTGNIGVGCFVDKSERKYISERSYSLLKCKNVIEGDILICRLADPAGRACIAPALEERKVVTSVDVTIFRPADAKVDRRFLVQLFTTKEWLQEVAEHSGGTTHKRIARGALGRLRIKLPPTLGEQQAIAAVLSDMDSEISALENKLAKARAVKQGMMQVLLTGKIRLI